jgi:hypothetical protein
MRHRLLRVARSAIFQLQYQNILGRYQMTVAKMKELDPLVFLKTVYLNADLPLSVRMRAAIEVLPFTHPKLAVTAQVTEMNDFASLLDKRIRRMEEAKLIEHQASQRVEIKPPLVRTSDRRFRSI